LVHFFSIPACDWAGLMFVLLGYRRRKKRRRP
jgi:hypothetical protein